MKIRAIRILAAATAVIFLATSLTFGHLVPIDTQMDILSSLRTTSAILLGIVGAWIAIVYPRDLKASLKSDASRIELRVSNFRRLTRILLIAVTILIVIVPYELAYGFLSNLEVSETVVWALRKSSMGLITILVLLQLLSLYLILVPVHAIRSEIEDIHRILKREKSLFRLWHSSENDESRSSESAKKS